jgi:hypothetical protein
MVGGNDCKCSLPKHGGAQDYIFGHPSNDRLTLLNFNLTLTVTVKLTLIVKLPIKLLF